MKNFMRFKPTKIIKAFCLSLLILVPSVLSLLAPLLTQTVSAAPDQKTITINGQKLSCYAVLNPSQNVQAQMNNLFRRGDGSGMDGARGSGALSEVSVNPPTSQIGKDFDDVQNGSQRYTISFTSQDSSAQGPCQQGIFFFQSSSDAKLFYGVILTGSHYVYRAGTAYDYSYISATVNPSAHSMTINGSVNETFHPSLASNADPNAWKKYFSGSGSGGGGDSKCDGKFSDATDANGTELCINYFSQAGENPVFEDFSHILYAGGTFQLESWQGPEMRYKLVSSPSDPTWVQRGNTYLRLETDNYGGPPNGLDVNITTTDWKTSIPAFRNGLSYAGKHTVNLRFTNMGVATQDGGTKWISVPNADPSNLDNLAVYYPQSKSVITDALQGGPNEQNFVGNYSRSDATTYIDDNGTSYGCTSDASRPRFSFSVDPSTLGPDQGQHGPLPGNNNDITDATWQLPVDGCGFVNIPVKVRIAGANETPPTVNGSGNNSGTQSNDCESKAGVLGWIMCSIITTLADAVNGIYTNVIVPMLQTPALSSSSAGGGKIRTAWATFRVFGNIFLVIVVLIVVFGESIGGGMLDAYTIKKILPRILIAAIMINLSYYAVALFIDITNIIGNGIRLLITGAFGINGNNFDLSSVNGSAQAGFLGISAAGVGVAIAAIDGPAIVMGVITFLFVILPWIFLLFLAIMAVLALRLGLIYILVLASPVAFALWVLPNTEKYFKKWFELLQTTAMVYPIISALFGLSMVLAQTTLWATGSKGFINGTIGYIVSLIIVVMPLVLIPFAFKLAGGIIGRAYEFASNGHKLGSNWLKKRGELRKQRMLGGTFFDPKGLGNTRLGGWANKQLQRNAVRAENENDEARGSRFGRARNQRKLMDDAIMARKEAHRKAYVEQMKGLYAGDENKIRAAMEAYDENGKFNAEAFRRNLRAHNVAGEPPKYTEDDIEQALTKVQRTRTQMGDTAFSIASAQAMLSNGTVNPDDNEKAMEWIHRATHGDKQAGINFMLAAAEEAKAAGRFDLFSSSPSDNIRAHLHQTGQRFDQEIADAGGTTEWLLQRAVETRSPGELAMMKGDGIDRVAPYMAGRLQQADAAVVATGEYRDREATKVQVERARTEMHAAEAESRAANEALENAQAAVTHGGEANSDQQRVINLTLQAKRAADARLAQAQITVQNAVNVHQQAAKKLESTPEYQELMHQSARVQGLADILGQVPDGKADAYANSVLGVQLSSGQTIGSFVSSAETTSNEVYRRYHKEYTDAEAARNAAYMGAANAIAGQAASNIMGPPGPPGPPPGPVT